MEYGSADLPRLALVYHDSTMQKMKQTEEYRRGLSSGTVNVSSPFSDRKGIRPVIIGCWFVDGDDV